MKKVVVGVPGCGAITQRRHAPEYAARKDVELAGFYDPNTERAEETARNFGGRAYSSPEEMLNDPNIDAISVCTPNNTHAEYTLAALKAGKHVLCEKPMALSTDETHAMLAEEKKSGKLLMLGHNQRMMAAHTK